jgi:hypothetical protein
MTAAQTANQSENIRYEFSFAIIRRLWIEGLITESEMKRIDKRNKLSFPLKESSSAER